MRYKNISKSVIKFRAHDKNGVKKQFILQPDEEFESDRVVMFGGLELVEEKKKKTKKTKQEDD